MKFKALIYGVFREAIAKKIFLGFFGISTLIIIIFLLMVNMDSVQGMVDTMKITGQDAAKQFVVGSLGFMVDISYLLIITFCIVSVSSFIPSMLEKGSIDLLLSKPISRPQIILGKFSGGVLLIFASLVYLLGAVWIIVSAKSGYWYFPFLTTILWLTFSFAVIYSVVILIGLLTQSTVLTIIINIFLVFVITPLLGSRETVLYGFITNGTIQFILNLVYYILPKPGDLNVISKSLLQGEAVKSWQPLITSFLLMVTCLSVSIFYFKKKDY